MLGNGGAHEEMRVVMEDTQKKCKEIKKMMGEHSFSQFVFDSELPVRMAH